MKLRILSLLILLSLGSLVVNAQDSSTEKTDNSPNSTTNTTTNTSTSSKPKPQASPDPKWEFAVTPYLFLARLDGEVGVLGETAQVNASFRDIFRNLDFALMGTFEARKGNWIFVGDAMYM